MLTDEEMATYLRGQIETLRAAEAEALKEYQEALGRWQQVTADLQAVTGMLQIVERDIAARVSAPSD